MDLAFVNWNELLPLKGKKNDKLMFEQVVGNGANEFLIIVAILFGFVNALAFIDHRKVTNGPKQEHEPD